MRVYAHALLRAAAFLDARLREQPGAAAGRGLKTSAGAGGGASWAARAARAGPPILYRRADTTRDEGRRRRCRRWRKAAPPPPHRGGPGAASGTFPWSLRQDAAPLRRAVCGVLAPHGL